MPTTVENTNRKYQPELNVNNTQSGSFYLLVTCYLYNDGRRISSLNAQISPQVLVQSVFERVNRWSVDNFLSQVFGQIVNRPW